MEAVKERPMVIITLRTACGCSQVVGRTFENELAGSFSMPLKGRTENSKRYFVLSGVEDGIAFYDESVL